MRALAELLWMVSRPEMAARPVRTMLVVGTVATGVALLSAMRVATDSVVGGFAEDLERLGGKADLQVTFGTGEMGFPEEFLDRVRSEPFVEHAAALVRGAITFEDEPRETVQLFGVDVLQEDVLDLYEVRVLERENDDFTILNDPRGIFLTDRIARERGLAVGDTTRMSAVDGVHDYTVRGIVATEGLAEVLGGKLVAMYLPAAQPVAGRRGDLDVSMVDQIDVALTAGANLGEAARALERWFGAGFSVIEPFQRRLMGEHTVRGLRATLVGMSTLALLAAIFVIYASTSTLVLQRSSTMATLRSVGASPRTLLRLVVAEATLLGSIGASAGAILGIGLAALVGGDVAAGMSLNYSLAFDVERTAYDSVALFVAHPLGGIAVTTLSAFAAARRLLAGASDPLSGDTSSTDSSAGYSMTQVGVVSVVIGGGGAWLLATGLARGAAQLVSFGGVAIIVGSVLASLPLLRGAWVRSTRLLESVFGLEGKVAAENLARSLDRSLVTASAIALCVAVAVGAASLVKSFRASVADWYGFSGDALVSSNTTGGGWLPSPLQPSLGARLETFSAVEAVETLRVLQGQPFGGERVAVVGMTSGLLSEAATRSRPLFGMEAAEVARRLRDGTGVAVSTNFVSRFPFVMRSGELEMATSTDPIRLPVIAIVPDYVSDTGSVILAAELLERRWHDRLVNFFSVRLRPGFGIGDLRDQLARIKLFPQAVAVVTSAEMVARVDALIGEAFADIDTIKLLVLFLTVVGIGDLIASNVIARRRELATLRLVGFSRSSLLRVAALEGLCVTLGAVVAGVAVGALCSWIWVRFNYPVLVGYVLQLRLSWEGIAICVALAVLAALVAGYVGARYAMRAPAVAMIRYD